MQNMGVKLNRRVSIGVRKEEEALAVANNSLALCASNGSSGSQPGPEVAKLPCCETELLSSNVQIL